MNGPKGACESCGGPIDAFAGQNFCKFCNAPLTFARRKAVSRTRGKLTEIFSNPSAAPSSTTPRSPRGVASPPRSPRGINMAAYSSKPSHASDVVVSSERKNRRKAMSVSCKCPGCSAKLLPTALFCTKCGRRVAEAEENAFCGTCGTRQVAGRAGEKVCPQCTPEQVKAPVLRKFDRSSIIGVEGFDHDSERDAVMKATLQQGTLLNVSSAGGLDPSIKSIKWSQLQLEREIGEGAYSVVYYAKYHKNIAVAVKEMKLDGSEAQNVEDFRMEVSVMHRVQHPGIVKFLGAAFEEDRLAYVLEYCKNGSLSFLLVREDVSMSWECRLGWARSIAEAVQYLHGLKPKIVHRDLKSDNVLITADWKAKICDFGLCKAKSLALAVASKRAAPTSSMRGNAAFGRFRANSRASVVAFSTIAGTPAYMAPELFRSEPYSQRVDVYSFGMVLWELLTREWAWDDDDDEGIREMVLAGERPEFPEWAPDALKDLIGKCWEALADKRPSMKRIVQQITSLPHGTWREPPNAY